MQGGNPRLLLLGAGHAHVQVLAQLAQQRPPGLDVTVLTPFGFQTYSGMTPGLVAGRYSEADCQIALEPLVQAAGARWVPGRCTHIDTEQQRVHVAASTGAGEVPVMLPYDWLSIDTGAVIDPERLDATLPGAREHSLPIRPIEDFAQRWPEVLALARERPVSLAVIGAGAGGIELVFAAAQRLRAEGAPGSRFTLVTGGGAAGTGYRPGVQARIERQLRRQGINVLRQACTGVRPGGVLLGNGATLECDVSILAIGTHAPPWLAGSGLALSDGGHVQVNRFQQSTSHANVFAAGDVSEREDQPHARSGVYAVRAGPPLAHNLLAAIAGQALKPHWPPQNTLNLLSCGTRHAIASWGPLHAEGAWVWRWKDRIDRGFIERYRRVQAGGSAPPIPQAKDVPKAL